MAREQSWECHLDMYPLGQINWEPCVAGRDCTTEKSLGPAPQGWVESPLSQLLTQLENPENFHASQRKQGSISVLRGTLGKP